MVGVESTSSTPAVEIEVKLLAASSALILQSRDSDGQYRQGIAPQIKDKQLNKQGAMQLELPTL